MNYCRFFTVFNPKTRKSTVVSTFHSSESSRFACQKITPEEQIVNAATDVAQALKDKPLLQLPNQSKKSVVKKL